MKWSWKIGTLAGIKVYMHATFLLLLGWIALTYWLQYETLIPTLVGVAFTLAIFGCVLLHEYGHALTARRFGIRTKDITLLPIGGVLRHNSSLPPDILVLDLAMPPRDELRVSRRAGLDALRDLNAATPTSTTML